jgi:hypothetical protein
MLLNLEQLPSRENPAGPIAVDPISFPVVPDLTPAVPSLPSLPPQPGEPSFVGPVEVETYDYSPEFAVDPLYYWW